MKRVLLSGLIMLLVVGLAGVSYASVDNTFEVAIISATGYVVVDANADGRWTSAEVGMKLKTGALIKTGEGASAEVVFDADGLNVLKIDEITQITIQRSMVEMSDGSILVSLKNLEPGTEFQVKTPNAICGVRGSGLGVDTIDVAGITVVYAFEGDTAYVVGVDKKTGKPTGKEVKIPEGWKTEILETGQVISPDGLSHNEIMVWTAWVRGVTVVNDLQSLAQLMQDAGQDVYNKDLDKVKEDAAQAEEDQPEVSP